MFNQPIDQWETSAKYRELVLFINVMHVVNDTAERLVMHCCTWQLVATAPANPDSSSFKLIDPFRAIKLVQDYMKTTRMEEGLQRTILAVDLMRETRGIFKNSNFNTAKLRNVLVRILALNN